MASVYVKTVDGGEDTTPAGTDAIELDDGSTSKWTLLSNLYKALGTGTATAAKALMGDGAWTTVTTPTSTETMTNKRITKRVASTTDDATAVIDSDSYDEYYLTAVANATEFTVTGTPTTGQEVFIAFKDAGVSKALTWTGITALGVTLPTATTVSKQHIVKIKYIASAWRAIAVAVES